MIVAFIGHREINITESLKSMLNEIIVELIINEKANIFLFGSNSDFDKLCYNTVTEL